MLNRLRRRLAWVILPKARTWADAGGLAPGDDRPLADWTSGELIEFVRYLMIDRGRWRERAGG